jgi:hypothetical protein
MTAYDKISVAPAAGAIPDDTAMLRAAVDLTRDLTEPKPAIYWADFVASAALGYAGLALAIFSHATGTALLGAAIAILALYRASGFIHELTHIRKGALPGFRLGWNLIVGIPLLIPSFLYEGVHTLHHARTRYGTAEDPEYLPLALMKPWSLPLFLLAATLAPVGLLIRFAVLTPLSLVIPPLRNIVVERYSALSINPGFRRRAPEGAFKRLWIWQEAGASLFALGLLGSVALVGWRPLLIYMAVFSGTAILNQLRTLVAHLWENEGDAITVTAQYLDSVNVPPPAMLAPIWAPVGLRYHALGEAHRRMTKKLGTESTYLRANHAGMLPLVARIARSTMR